MRESPSLPSRFLVIETDAAFSSKLSRYIQEEWPDASVDIHLPQNGSLPDEDFPWSQYDVLFLDCDLGDQVNALEWLNAMRPYPFFPVTILITDAADTEIAVKAIKAGADDYLSKDAISWASIYASVIDAMLYSKSQRAEELRAQRAILGPKIDGVSIDYKLNQGGFSALYLGTRDDGKKVVIKTLLLDKALDPVQVQRFKNEAAILKSLKNKYVVDYPRVWRKGRYPLYYDGIFSRRLFEGSHATGAYTHPGSLAVSHSVSNRLGCGSC